MNNVGPHVNGPIITGVFEPGNALHSGAGESPEEKLNLLRRISSSPQFQRSTKLREFLIHVVEQTLQGQAASLSEQQIGRAVFGRAADYSPSEDNVVRAHARQLRVKLSEYFAASGKAEILVLEIPKGSYVASFSTRASAPEAPSAEPVEQASDQPKSSRFSWPLFRSWPLLTVLIVALGTIFFLSVQNWALHRQVDGLRVAVPGSIPAPLAWVFEPDHAASLVVADSCFGLMQDMAGRPASLDEYVNPRFWQSFKPSSSSLSDDNWLMRRIGSRELTSYADLLLAARILRIADQRAKVSIRFARDLHTRELSSGNFIFLGSSYVNPWLALYDRKRNFRIQVDAASRQSIINKKPRPGELASYHMLGEDGVPGVTYGLIAFCPSDGVTGNALILEGTNMEGTEAAGGMILDPKSARDTLSLAGISDLSRTHPFFEILVETKVLDGAPSRTRVVAVRK